MPTTLSGPFLRAVSSVSDRSFIGRICDDPATSPEDASRSIFRKTDSRPSWPPGYRAYIADEDAPTPPPELRDAYVVAPQMRYLAAGDIVRIDPPRNSVTALFRRSSPSNAFLVTEQCDNYCVMCSQPPRLRPDAWLVDEIMEVIPLVSKDTREVALTGGEPALLGERLCDLVACLREHLPRTGVHVLTNGRRFADEAFARSLGRVGHPDLVLGIPLYSDLPEEHDFVVQARGGFRDAVRGILNLKRSGLRVEVRFVIHRDTVTRLGDFAHFLARNLLFVDHVALMGLELAGFARTNLDALWIDPVDYEPALEAAVEVLDRAGMRVSIYNLPLCVLAPALWPFARQSISDWKNEYIEECTGCAKRAECAGFFTSSLLRRSRGIRPFLV